MEPSIVGSVRVKARCFVMVHGYVVIMELVVGLQNCREKENRGRKARVRRGSIGVLMAVR